MHNGTEVNFTQARGRWTARQMLIAMIAVLINRIRQLSHARPVHALASLFLEKLEREKVLRLDRITVG